ncbi:MAG: SdiA-regulated domain-containing protein [Ferruginibacter sp.]|nr:SdiA-regulated domain-containing protein [Ferruginibacter sp.]
MTKILIPGMLVLCCLLACSQRTEPKSPAGYNLGSPEIIKLPALLNEISGISFNNGDPDTLYAEQDEDGKVFYFKPGTPDISSSRFHKKGDYEDISISKGKVFILRSDGSLFSFDKVGLNGDEATGVREHSGILPRGEYEAMFVNPADGKMVILCKSCKGDNPSQSITGYVLNTGDSSLALDKDFQVNSKEISALLDNAKVVFRPSAVTLNPVTNEWFILSSVNKLLVVADNEWKVKQVFKLDPTLFSQPEGIAFDRERNLYISNERGDLNAATVLKFIYKNNNEQ